MKSMLPKFDALMIPTLQALKALGGSASNEELHDWIGPICTSLPTCATCRMVMVR